MAVNAASHNAAGIPTGPNTAPPPSVPASTKADILEAAGSSNQTGVGEPTGQSAPGKDVVSSNAKSAVDEDANAVGKDGLTEEEREYHVMFKGEVECGPHNNE